MDCIKIYVDKKSSLAIKILFFMVAFYFSQDIYYFLSSGVVIREGALIEESKNPLVFYLVILKQFAFVFIFGFYALFGVKSKENEGSEKPPIDKQENQED